MENLTKKIEYINLENIGYEFIIEEMIMDVNNFVPILEHEVAKEEKPKKQGKNKSGDKSGKKKNKNKDDDLALSKESSKMSIFSTKPAKKQKMSKDLEKKLKVFEDYIIKRI